LLWECCMKILDLHQCFNTLEMSGGTCSYEMARHLGAVGYEVHMTTSGVEETDQTDWGIDFYWFLNNYNKASYIYRFKFFFRLSYFLSKKCKYFKNIDLVFLKIILSNMSLVTLKVLEN